MINIFHVGEKIRLFSIQVTTKSQVLNAFLHRPWYLLDLHRGKIQTPMLESKTVLTGQIAPK